MLQSRFSDRINSTRAVAIVPSAGTELVIADLPLFVPGAAPHDHGFPGGESRDIHCISADRWFAMQDGFRAISDAPEGTLFFHSDAWAGECAGDLILRAARFAADVSDAARVALWTAQEDDPKKQKTLRETLDDNPGDWVDEMEAYVTGMLGIQARHTGRLVRPLLAFSGDPASENRLAELGASYYGLPVFSVPRD